jgi:hypothetical protein
VELTGLLSLGYATVLIPRIVMEICPGPICRYTREAGPNMQPVALRPRFIDEIILSDSGSAAGCIMTSVPANFSSLTIYSRGLRCLIEAEQPHMSLHHYLLQGQTIGL